jgi:hypothetical protein
MYEAEMLLRRVRHRRNQQGICISALDHRFANSLINLKVTTNVTKKMSPSEKKREKHTVIFFLIK